MEVIKYKPVSLWAQKLTEVEVSEIHLFETHIRMHWKFYANEPKDVNDLDLGWDNDVYNYFDVSIKKEHIVGLELGHSDKNKAWYCCIMCNSIKDTNLYVKRQSEAEDIYNKLYEYLFGKQQ